VTVPLGVLKKSVNLFSPFLDADKVKSTKCCCRSQHETVRNAGFFSQLKAIENMREGRMAKLYLEWSEPWWNHGEGFLNFAWSREV
jgi:hypothetical protein